MKITSKKYKLNKDNVVKVDVLPKGQPVSPEKVNQYYKLTEGPRFNAVSRPNPHDRLVFLEQGSTSHYYIVPDNGHYKFSE